MAAIASGNVSYSITNSQKNEAGRIVNKVTLTFGDGVLTYPALGVPLLAGKLGIPTTVESFNVIDDGAKGFLLSYDLVNTKLRIFQGPGALGALPELGAVTVAAQTIKVEGVGW